MNYSVQVTANLPMGRESEYSKARFLTLEEAMVYVNRVVQAAIEEQRASSFVIVLVPVKA